MALSGQAPQYSPEEQQGLDGLTSAPDEPRAGAVPSPFGEGSTRDGGVVYGGPTNSNQEESVTGNPKIAQGTQENKLDGCKE